MKPSEIAPSVLDQLRKFDTPTICNVLELFDVMPRTAGYMDGRIKANFPALPPMVGFASTATFRAGAPPRAGDVYAGLSKQVDMLVKVNGPSVVVFQDLDDPAAAATFGEIMCSTYKAFGSVGLITSGAGRDLDQVEALKFPVFTGGTICSHGYSSIVDLEVPVRVGGVWVNPGDLLHGDRNGVAAIPTSIAAAVAEACPAFMAAEAVVLEYLKAGNVSPTGFDAARIECLRRITELSRKLKSRAG